MKSLIPALALGVLVAVVCLAQSVSGQTWFVPPNPDVYWYNQTLDHFNSSDTRTFHQRYLVYDQYWKNYTANKSNPPPPIFFCPGGEAGVKGGYEHNGFMFQYGMTLGAFMLFPEHRFYGESIPFGPVDAFKPENINKLTVEQALSDYVEIISYVRAKWGISPQSPLIAFGGSYPGELASFMRLAYPDIVLGAVASSAPVRYHPGLTGGTHSGAFYAVATASFGRKNPECPELAKKAFEQIYENWNTTQGIQWVSEQLKLCSPMTNAEGQLRLLNLWIENAFATLGMENYPYAIGDYPAFPMDVACQVMTSHQSGSLVYKLGQAIGVTYNASGDLSCFNISKEYYPCADITGCGGGVADPDARSWDYQSCTEIVANVDTNNRTDMFPPAPYNFTRLTEYCQHTWGTTPDPLHIPQLYNYTLSSYIIYSNGFLDPWWPGGILEGNNNNEVYALQMEEAAHHLDLRGSDPADPPSVVKVRNQERQIINGWLNAHAEKYHKLNSQ